MIREEIEWDQIYWYSSNTHHLPRILLIGDSIVAGHRQAVADRMKDKAVIVGFSTSRIVGDPAMYRELGATLADYPVDLIYCNNGLHGFEYDDDYYRRNLSAFIDFLRLTTKARIHWRNSTPLVKKDQPTKFRDRNDDVIRRNKIAEEIMAKFAIPTDDLYSVMLGHPEYYSDGTHCTPAGVKAQADHIAAYLTEALKNHTLTYQMNGFTTDFPGMISDWHGFERCDFKVNDVGCILIKPNCKPDPEKRWYWRAHFFGAFPNEDFDLLKRGWYVAHIAVPELYGSPECMRRFDLLYQFLTAMGFNKKTVIAGYSRGGLDTYLWAAKNTDKVSCLYLDNPVCDFKSWPGGKGVGPGSKEGWKNCLAAWNFTEEQAMAFKGNPVDNLKPLADAGIPILHVCGDADEVVPPSENTILVEKRYKELGGHIEVIWKPGGKHHPHCLENPKPITDFILKHS